MYVSPEGSKYYQNREHSTIETLEEIFIKIHFDFPGSNILLAGDMNARTGDLVDYIIDDSLEYITNEDIYPIDDFNQKRHNLDKEINAFGTILIHLCKTHGIHIVNGRFPSDADGMFTSHANKGASVVDYMVASTELFPSIKNFSVIDDSDHFPITCCIETSITGE
ncbi:hypothetical protein SNE40_008917 [Patella caerulea]|uniref:Endonuclease/exonuclease/phosphatase domain-containing protein n=1 Tax=Patella caerulea TaxID=87958 RepID=A0AAN8PRB0_PATCE